MKFILVLRSTFDLPQEPMMFILVLRSTFVFLFSHVKQVWLNFSLCSLIC